WKYYYSKLWHLASLSFHYSNISEEDWKSVGENTNTAEFAYDDANHE
ncbi:2480_t:CDS:1, partial [Gigaspora rosea]